MATDGTTEQKNASAEVAEKGNGADNISASTLIQKGLSQIAKDTVSTKTSEDQTKGEKKQEAEKDSKPFKVFKSEDEYNLHLEKETSNRVQTAKDKELSPLQGKVSELTKENAKLKKELTYKKEDFALEDRENAEKDAWTDESHEEVGDFQEKRRQLIKDIRELDEFKAKAKEDGDKLNGDKNSLENERLAVKYLLGDKAEVFSKEMETVIKELADCKTLKEKELTLKVRGVPNLDEKPKPEEKKHLTKVDSSKLTSPGAGKDYTVIGFGANDPSASEMIREGLKNRKK